MALFSSENGLFIHLQENKYFRLKLYISNSEFESLLQNYIVPLWALVLLLSVYMSAAFCLI